MTGEWLGGPCPQCGEEMPARLVHCRSCRALLNSELTEDSIEIPSFFALPEISVTASASPRGHYVSCPGCLQELRIHSKYKGLRVQCKHCQQEIRAGLKYIGHKVVCKHCGGHLQLQAESG